MQVLGWNSIHLSSDVAGLAKLVVNEGSGEPQRVLEPQRDPLSPGSEMHMNLCPISSGQNSVGPLPASTSSQHWKEREIVVIGALNSP